MGTDDQPLAEWRRETADIYVTLARQVPVVHRRPGSNTFLIDPIVWTVTGIIDWGDAAIVDPAYEFGLLYRDLGPAAVDAAFRSYRTDVKDVATLRARAVFYARCSVFEDLAYGLESGRDRYVDKSLAAMQWLF